MIIRMVATQSSVGTLARERLARKTANRPQHLAPKERSRVHLSRGGFT